MYIDGVSRPTALTRWKMDTSVLLSRPAYLVYSPAVQSRTPLSSERNSLHISRSSYDKNHMYHSPKVRFMPQYTDAELFAYSILYTQIPITAHRQGSYDQASHTNRPSNQRAPTRPSAAEGSSQPGPTSSMRSFAPRCEVPLHAGPELHASPNSC